MPEFRYISPDEMASRHRAAAPRTPAPSRQTRTTRQRNVEVVLSLGDVRYIMFHGVTYRVPPVPFKLGQRVLASYGRIVDSATQVVHTGKKKSADVFYSNISAHARLLWKHIRPIGKVKRALWRLGLTKNPFLQASEEEVKDLTDFFLQGRMTSSVRATSGAE